MENFSFSCICICACICISHVCNAIARIYARWKYSFHASRVDSLTPSWDTQLSMHISMCLHLRSTWTSLRFLLHLHRMCEPGLIVTLRMEGFIGDIAFSGNSLENDVLSRFLSNLVQLIFMHRTFKKCNKTMGSLCLFLRCMPFILSVFLMNYLSSVRNLINRTNCCYTCI